MSCCIGRRGRHLAPRFAFATEALLALGSIVCFALMVAHIISKTNQPDYGYPYRSVEGAMAFVLGVLM